MPAPEGNKFYQLRKSHGPKFKFKSPNEIWKLACQYFEWADQNPIKVWDPDGNPKSSTPRPYTLQGFFIHAKITRNTWYRYKEGLKEGHPKKDEFEEVCEYIDQIIYDQAFSGAAVGIYHHQLIARKLGLADNVDVKSDGKKIEPVSNTWNIHPVTTNKESGS